MKLTVPEQTQLASIPQPIVRLSSGKGFPGIDRGAGIRAMGFEAFNRPFRKGLNTHVVVAIEAVVVCQFTPY